jgi:CO dehydrogenase/acetyl-CoA synthase gamma subunit (corrinoid Fe-S protein)
MKKVIIATLCLFVSTLFTSCGVGNYTVTSGVEDKAAVCFSAPSAYDIDVTIDGQQYATSTVKDIAHKTRRNIKQTAKRSIVTTPGRHKVEVKRHGETVYSKEVMLSTGETKIIEL